MCHDALLCLMLTCAATLCPNICCRDLSLNLLSSFPTAGLSAVSQLKLTGNLEMKGILTARDLPKLRSVTLALGQHVALHCGTSLVQVLWLAM